MTDKERYVTIGKPAMISCKSAMTNGKKNVKSVEIVVNDKEKAVTIME